MLADVIILAGGQGTRLQGVLDNVPKCMAPIAGRPFIEYQLMYLMHYRLYNIILAIGHLKEAVINHFEGYWRTCGILHSIEEEPLGTGGALKYAVQLCTSEMFLAMNGDTLFMANLMKLFILQENLRADAVIALRRVPDASRYGSVVIDKNGRITEFNEKSDQAGEGLINGGIYLMKRKVIENYPSDGKFSLEEEFLPQVCKDYKIYGIEFSDYFIDIGVPEDLERAERELPSIGLFR